VYIFSINSGLGTSTKISQRFVCSSKFQFFCCWSGSNDPPCLADVARHVCCWPCSPMCAREVSDMFSFSFVRSFKLSLSPLSWLHCPMSLLFRRSPLPSDPSAEVACVPVGDHLSCTVRKVGFALCHCSFKSEFGHPVSVRALLWSPDVF
jgi:hypothetical protein